MRQFEKEYRAEMPETIGETDRAFDDQNYSEFLERWILKLLATPAVINAFCEQNQLDNLCAVKRGYNCNHCGGINKQNDL